MRDTREKGVGWNLSPRPALANVHESERNGDSRAADRAIYNIPRGFRLLPGQLIYWAAISFKRQRPVRLYFCDAGAKHWPQTIVPWNHLTSSTFYLAHCRHTHSLSLSLSCAPSSSHSPPLTCFPFISVPHVFSRSLPLPFARRLAHSFSSHAPRDPAHVIRFSGGAHIPIISLASVFEPRRKCTQREKMEKMVAAREKSPAIPEWLHNSVPRDLQVCWLNRSGILSAHFIKVT